MQNNIIHMFYSQILDTLYNGTSNDIVNILNNSVYSTSLNKVNHELIIIHTGFSFFTHKEKEMELYAGFSLNNNKILLIRQSRADWANVPQVNGLQMKITNRNYYLTEVENGFCYEIDETEDDYNLKVQPENKDNLYYITLDYLAKNFGHFKINTKNGVLNFPWYRQFKDRLYLDGTKFHTVSPIDKREGTSDNCQSFDDYLRSDYGDDAETAYWNID